MNIKTKNKIAIEKDPNASRKFNSMKNYKLAEILNDFCNGKYEQNDTNIANFNSLLKIIIGRLKTLDGAKPKKKVNIDSEKNNI